jgi:adenine-specific DNA methylase
MNDHPRLIEVAFPLKQASLDSVHEKNVRHGHISTLHIWPARRPMAACRAALIATLLPDPGNDEERQQLLERMGGKVVRTVEQKQQGNRIVEVVKEETDGGILHWGRENGPDLAWFREEIRKAYGGRAPRVLDPFAGGGAIPLEAMRLGCEATAVDINPVAWFILKCTLEYPQRLAGHVRPLPKFAVESREFMEGFFAGTGVKGKRQLEKNLDDVQQGLFPPPDVDLAWHVRALGWWVLQRARADLERFYPVVAGKPTVAYLWARTVPCKNCRAMVPMLKTRWLCKKESRRVVLTMQPDPAGLGVVFGVQDDVPVVGGNSAQRREYDRQVGAGTMSRSGATCPCCRTIITGEDIRLEGQAGRLGCVLTAVAVAGPRGKEYRPATDSERSRVEVATAGVSQLFADVPLGLPDEAIPRGGSRAGGGSPFTVFVYGLTRWRDLFTPTQLFALGTFVKYSRAAREAMRESGYPPAWIEAITAYLALAIDRLADRSSVQCRPDPTPTQSGVINTFSRFALPITWDFIEGVTTQAGSGGFLHCLEWVALVIERSGFAAFAPRPNARCASVKLLDSGLFDVIVTDPPYYDAIPYSDLMDFFYIWLRRSTRGLSAEIDEAFQKPLGPKWNHQTNDGELIDDASRQGGDLARSKAVYEEGMFHAFQACHQALAPDGRLVIVFAHKHPNAWETLVSAIIRAGFVVDGSWPIQTEMGNRTRALSSAALSSSVWLVCKKRPAAARPGWDNQVLDEMRANIHQRLHDYWKAGIRGPDFVWAATGPALEAFSKHPVVKKATAPGETMSVSEFLRAVRRLVVDFVVGRVLTGNGDGSRVEGLDDLTTYYLLHRQDFGMDDAPAGACILYAVSCGLSDSAIVDRHDLLVRTGGKAAADADEEAEAEEEPEAEEGGGSGSRVKLKRWSQRKRKTLGYDAEGYPAPLIDQVHRLMHLWKAGEVVKVDEYLNDRGLRRNALFHQLLQALIELSERGGEERSLLECVSNHIVARGVDKPAERTLFGGELFARPPDDPTPA